MGFTFTLFIVTIVITSGQYVQSDKPVAFIEFSTHNFKGYIHTMVTNPKVSWEDARGACKSHGLELSSARNREEYEFFKTLAKNNAGLGSSRPWSIWLNSRGNGSGKFTWLETGADIDSYFWAPNEPKDKVAISSNCICLWSEPAQNPQIFGGDDQDCSALHGFFCRTPNAIPEPTNPECQFSCEGRTCGNYPDPNNCYSYYTCFDVKSKYMYTKCEHGLVFNSKTRQCDAPQYVTCPCKA